MKEENNIERLFQDTFEGFEVTPPPAVKSAIDKGIAAKRGGMGWLLGALLVLIIGSLFAWKFLSTTDDTKTQQRQIAQTEQEDNSSAEETVSQTSSAAVVSTNTSTDASKRSNQNGENTRTTNSSETPKVQGNQSVTTNDLGNKKQPKSLGATPSTSINNSQKSISKKNTNQNSAASKKKNNSTSKKNDSGKSSFTAKKGGGTLAKNGDAITPSNQLVESNSEKKDDNKSSLSNTDLSSSKTSSPTIDSTKTAETPKKDTTTTASTANQQTVATSTNKRDDDKSNDHKWMVTLSGGPAFGSRAASEGLSIKEKTGYQFGLGVTRSFNTSLPLAVGLDFEYGSRKETYSKSEFDSLHYFLDSIPIYDSTILDSIVGYQTSLDSVEFYSDRITNSIVNRYAFGLSVPITVFESNQFGFIVTPGFRYNMNSFVMNDGSPTIKLASYQYKLGLDLYYDWRRFRFSAGLDSRYEQLGKNSNLFTQDRSRWMFVPNVGVGFKF